MEKTTREIAYLAIEEHGAIQKTGELEKLLKLMLEEKVHDVLEIGFFHGGTQWAFTKIGCFVHSVDINGASKSKIDKPNVLRADSHDPETILRIRDWGIESFDCLFIDAEHSFRSVLLDYYNYNSMVKPGGIIVFHDICPTILRDMDTGKPCNVEKAWRIITKDRRERTFEIIEKPTTWGGIGVIWK